MSKLIRASFSYPAGGAIDTAMADYNKHERSVIIKEALHMYFYDTGRRVIRHNDELSTVGANVGKVECKSQTEQIPAANILGDFGD